MFADKQAVLNAFRFRHACKSYDAAKKIPADDFAYILETARLSPSSFGLEPWRGTLAVLGGAEPYSAPRVVRHRMGRGGKNHGLQPFCDFVGAHAGCHAGGLSRKKSGAARMECRLKLLK